MSETLYEFIQRTLIPSEYRRRHSAKEFERKLLNGEGNLLAPMEMSYVVNPGSIRIREILKWE